jgi:hypothetical protein
MSLLGGHLLHLAARLATRLWAPERAKWVTDAVGFCMPRLRSSIEAGAYLAELSGRGTCLTRALAVAARWPGAEVVIGGRTGEKGAGFSAHAWVENEGVELGRDTNIEIARL